MWKGHLGGTLLQSLRKGAERDSSHCPGSFQDNKEAESPCMSTYPLSPVSSGPSYLPEKRSHSLGKSLNIGSSGLLVQTEVLRQRVWWVLLLEFSERQGPATSKSDIRSWEGLCTQDTYGLSCSEVG